MVGGCYTVIYEDENFLAVNKESGVLVHKTTHGENNLIEEIIQDFREERYLVHRIDRYTSGVVLLAKDRGVLRMTQELFSKGEIRKSYLAIVGKELPAKRIKISLSLGRNRNNKLMFSNKNAKNYKPACTEVEVIDKYLIRIFPKTGRTHQIRAHLYSIGNPVLNDPVYGGNCFDEEFGQYLHAHTLEFDCPRSGKKIFIEAPLPEKFLDKLRELNLCLN